MFNQILCQGTNYLQFQVHLYPLEIFRLQEQKGGYMTKTLTCNGHSDENISYLIKKP